MLKGLRILWFLLLPYWQRQIEPDPTHPRGRTLTRRYRQKKRVVRGLWIATGLLMLAYPLTPFVVTLGLFTAFLSFTILDESA